MNALLSELPILVLFPHARCNCRCVMCDIWKERESRQLTRSDVESLLPALLAKGTRQIVLSGGEPLMHQDLFALVALLKDSGLAITLLSSGLLLEKHAAAITAGVSDVIVSLDGPRELHDAIRRVPRAFDRMHAGIRALHALRQGFPVAGRCTVQRQNAHRLRETARAAKELGLESLSFLAADVSSEAFNRPGGWDEERTSEVALTPEEVDALAAEIDALERDCAADVASGFLAESPEKLRRRVLAPFRAGLGLEEPVAPRCNAPWVSAVVEADGTVRPCFFQPAYGNLRDGGFDSVVNGAAGLSFRETLDVASNPICKRCVCSLYLEAAP